MCHQSAVILDSGHWQVSHYTDDSDIDSHVVSDKFNESKVVKLETKYFILTSYQRLNSELNQTTEHNLLISLPDLASADTPDIFLILSTGYITLLTKSC
ncbi:hypothetical protein [Pseudobacteriovorax antillogorgiicola]|nr:hypothetical protein [Pseudobacteriovorax antillogorgiicola]